MKKLILAVVAALCATALVAQAQDAAAPAKKAKKELTAEQKELLAKYDTNKDGKLSKEEKAAMTAEDKAKWGPANGKKKAASPAEGADKKQ
jgi:hypothetical protein